MCTVLWGDPSCGIILKYFLKNFFFITRALLGGRFRKSAQLLFPKLPEISLEIFLYLRHPFVVHVGQQHFGKVQRPLPVQGAQGVGELVQGVDVLGQKVPGQKRSIASNMGQVSQKNSYFEIVSGEQVLLPSGSRKPRSELEMAAVKLILREKHIHISQKN